ncbi:MAG: ABC transporter substrate-binding protein [Methanoregula sp.]|nr:ABC transporter substrate-binding protein [Methanoregula sp.]
MILCTVGISGCLGTAESQSAALTGEDIHPTPVESPITLTDSFGNTITLPHTARRIICQNGDAAELLINLGAGDRVVGAYNTVATTPQYMHYFPNAVSIGDWQAPDVEQIIALKPDVIIMYSGFRPRNYDLIAANNITIVYLDCYKISELPADARAIGNLTGKRAEAEEYAQFVERYLDIVRSRVNTTVSRERPLRVYAELYGDYSALGKNSSGDHLIRMMEAENIAREIPLQSMSTNKVSAEWIIEQNPDIILKIASTPSATNPSLAQVRENILNRPGFGKINAVKNGRVYVIDGDIINGPTRPVGLMYIAKSFYPDLFADISPDAVYQEFSEKYPFTTEFPREAIMVPTPG